MIRRNLAERFRPGGIGRHISWLLLQSGIEAGTMTLAALLAARWFGPVAWGQLGILLAGVQLISLMGDGFFPTIIKYVTEARTARNPNAALIGWKFMGVSVAVMILVAAVLGVAALAVFPAQLSVVWVALAALLAIGRGGRASFDGIYRGLQQFRTPSVAGSVTVAATALAIIIASANGYRVSVYLAIMVAGIAANCLWLFFSFRRQYLRQGSAEGGLSGDVDSSYSTQAFLKYSLPLALRGIWTFLFLKINIWMLAGFASEYDAGQFRLTEQFLTIPSLLLSSVLAAVAPRVVAAHLGGTARLEQFLSRVYALMLLLTIPLALFFWFNEPIITVLFPAYADASRMLSYFAPAMLVMGLGFAASIIPVQAGKPGLALVITVFSGAANVVVAYMGLRWYGVTGLAIGTAAVHFVTYLASLIATHWAFKIPFRIRLS